jgi:Secretion system C-terminal sorting domain
LLNAQIAHFAGEKISDTESKLDWTTASENNNRGFYVEKSYDAQNFETIGFVEGAGNSQTAKAYSFVDKKFFYSAYYRLRQVDFNGNLAYSAIIWVQNGIFQLYPNPSRGNVTLRLPTEANAEVQIVLFDAVGRQVGKQASTAQANSQALSDILSALPTGTYIVVVRAGGQQWREKVIKL